MVVSKSFELTDPKPTNQSFRISLASFMLVVGLGTCVFLSWHLSTKRDRLQETVYDLRIQSKKLRVDDPSKVAVIGRERILLGEQIFDFYVPSKPKFEMCIKVEAIANNSDYTNPIARYAMPAGRMEIEVVEDRYSPNVVVLLDDNKVMDVKKSKDAIGLNNRITMCGFQSCTSFAADETVCLYSQTHQFNQMRAISKDDSTSLTRAQCDELDAKKLGILIWIHAVK
jgi:hypothetical protein